MATASSCPEAYANACSQLGITENATFISALSNTSPTTWRAEKFLTSPEVRAISAGLIGNQTITCLDLARAHIGLTDAVGVLINALQQNIGITSLDLSENDLKDDNVPLVSTLFEFMPALYVCKLSNNMFSAGSIVKLAQAAQRGKTKAFDFIGNETTTATSGDALAATCREGGLTSLAMQLPPAASEAFINKLDTCALRVLKLSHAKLPSAIAVRLAAWLHGSPALVSLDLSHCYIGGAAGSALMTAVANNTVLTALNLAHNALGVTGGYALASCLAVMPSCNS